MNRIVWSLVLGIGLLGSVGKVSGLDVAYDNTVTFTGQAFAAGGASGGITRMIMDDITPVALGVSDVTSFAFSVFNGNATAQSVRARVRFWLPDGAGGGPGTYYASPAAIGYTFAPFTFGANSVTTLTGTVAPGFLMPQTTFWAGITFDNVGSTTGATDVELNNFGMGIFDPPAVGSSTDTFFVTTAAGSFFNVANPAGTLTNFGGNPVANFGWRFDQAAVIPEPASTGLLLAGVLGLVALRSRKRV